MRKALVVEDDADIVELVSLYLGKDGWDVESVSDGKRALEKVRRGTYQLIILDIQLPGMDGLSVCAELRRDKASASVPLVMLTARGDEADRVVGLEMGADDYVVKPFSPKELLARVRALFRRLERKDETDGVHPVGVVEVDRGRHLVRCAGQEVHLTAKEFALLLALIDARGRVLSRDALLQDVWGYSYTEGPHRGRPRAPPAREDARLRRLDRDREIAGVPYSARRRMTRFGLRERIAVGAVAASAAALVAVLLLVGPDLRRRTVANTRTTLLAEARLMARVVERPLAEGAPPAEIDALVDGTAREVSARVTIIAPDGRVLADSSLSGPDLAAVENHAARPEVGTRCAAQPAVRCGTAPPSTSTSSTPPSPSATRDTSSEWRGWPSPSTASRSRHRRSRARSCSPWAWPSRWPSFWPSRCPRPWPARCAR
jgi:DNA-binding response OmpR family regulator